ARSLLALRALGGARASGGLLGRRSHGASLPQFGRRTPPKIGLSVGKGGKNAPTADPLRRPTSPRKTATGPWEPRALQSATAQRQPVNAASRRAWPKIC